MKSPKATILLLLLSPTPHLLLPTTAYQTTTTTTTTSTLQRLTYASSLSYLPLHTIPTSPYHTTSNLTPLSQVTDPQTESSATLFSPKENPNRLIVACRGSATPKNFVTNLKLNLVPASKQTFGGKGRVHGGFQEASFGLWDCLKPELEQFTSPEKEICFTGHSLGGATALLCAAHATAAAASSSSGDDAVVEVAEVVTFGGPRIGDATFTKHMDETILSSTAIKHVVHDADPVLQNNQLLWDTLGFECVGGEEIVCDPYRPTIYENGEESEGESEGGVAWNFLDHCKYMGTFVGPRIKI